MQEYVRAKGLRIVVIFEGRDAAGKGGVIKREMEDYVRRRHIEEGFDYVGTPHISKGGLFETSGHLAWYAEGMYPPM